MTATVPFVQKTFDKYNELCFGGALPPVPIVLTRARTFLGKITYVGKRNMSGRVVGYGDFTLRFSVSFDLPADELEDVVIHEMIHYHIALHGIRDTSVHGDVFRRMMDDINRRYGRNISVRHYADPGTAGAPEETVRANWLCVTQLEDGSWGITSCAKSRVFEMHRYLPKCYKLRSLKWYGSIDTFFNRYPRSIKPRIYRITKEELDAHLSDAVPLKCDGRTIEPV